MPLNSFSLAWNTYELVELRFRPPLRTNSLGKLASLSCDGKVEDYQEQFLVKLCRQIPSQNAKQIEFFTMGL